MHISLEAVGLVHSTRTQAIDDFWDQESAYIELTEAYTSESLQGLDTFSHVAVIFHMHQVDRVTTGVRRPRNREDWPEIGIFAQRGKNRPNAIGLTVCRVLKIEGRRLHVQGLDAIDGTPVLDIKPWVGEMGARGSLKEPEWMAELMENYWE
jgi:tRNA (adenine37-N6)-methyltransferase